MRSLTKEEHAAARVLIADTETSATALLTIAMSVVGDGIFQQLDGEDALDFTLLIALLEEEFSVSVPEEAEAKLGAIIAALETDRFFTDPLAFRGICLALTEGTFGDVVNGAFEDITAAQMAWGLFEVSMLRDDNITLAPSVEKSYQDEVRETAMDSPSDGLDTIQRMLIAGKTQIVRELSVLGATVEVLAQVINYDETPIDLEDFLPVEAA